MSQVIGENVNHVFGDRQVLRNVSFYLGESDRVGLVGPNGEGKTTLLKLIGGMLEPTSGHVHRAKGLRIGYLPQEPPALPDVTIHGACLDAFADVRRMETDLHTLADRMATAGDDPELLDRYGVLQADFETRGGYRYAQRIEEVLTGLAFPRDMWVRPLSQLSGGQRTRVCLATLLLQDCDVLMLDEPTNHLDLDSIEWLEQWLATFRGAIITVSHDRYFLDRVTATTWEIAAASLEPYRGSYSRYVPQREERHKERLARYEAQQEFIRKTEDFIRRNIYAARTDVAQGRKLRLERFLRDEAVERPAELQTMHLHLEPGARTGDMVFRASGLVAGYDAATPLLEAEELTVMRGDRVAILGSNGVGKTTLLRTLIGQMPSLAGDVKRGAKVEVGYMSQAHDELPGELSALDCVLAAGDARLSPQRVRTLLGSLLLGGDDAFKPVAQLSGGQQSRVALARLVVQGPSVLVLDEPTNHLDIPSTEVIQEMLQQFDGAVLMVSHDRYLVQAVATHIWAIESRRVTPVLGGWEAYLKWRQKCREEAAAAVSPDGAKAARIRTYEDRKTVEREARREASRLARLKARHETVEKEIQVLEADLARRLAEITAAGEAGDLGRVESLGCEYQQEQDRLQVLWAEWEQVGRQIE
jgi:ATP-binding cassette, subfamily F, member 3